MQNSFYVTARAVGFSFPNGEELFSGIGFTVSRGRYALVGPNGVGKSTLAKVIAGLIPPSAGEVRSSQGAVYLPQMEARPASALAAYLSPVWDSPFFDPLLFQRLIGGLDLERPLSALSGGEWARARIFKALCESPGLLILDEPTNNLDAASRALVYELMKTLEHPVLIISHDRELLELVDVTLELSNRGISVYGGNYSFYSEERMKERERQDAELDRLRREKKKREREMERNLQRQEKRVRKGEAEARRGGIPRIMIGLLRNNAEKTQGKVGRNEEKRVEEARQNFSRAFSETKSESVLKVDLPETQLAAGKMVFEIEDFNFRFDGAPDFLWREPLGLVMKGPQRWSLGGNNGSGKSTLLHLLTGRKTLAGERRGRLRLQSLPWAYLDQEFDLLDASKTVLENVQSTSKLDVVEIRNRLAMFQITKDKVRLPVASLSGGERFKVALAKVLLAAPAPQLLILDEPTNNLDISSIEVLEEALRGYKGALLAVSHDKVFLENVDAQTVVELG